MADRDASAQAYGHSLADIYDLAYDTKDYAAEAKYLVSAVRRHHPQASSLLETAAGTGRFLELLRLQFTDIEGLDLSAAMLTRAALRVPGVRLHEADMTTFEIGRTFDVVCCLFRSIAYCGTVERLRAAVRAMAQHLAPDGLLVIEPFFSPATYWVGRVTANNAERGDFKLAWMYVSEREHAMARLRIHYMAGTPAGVEHFEELHELGLFDRADFEAAFEAAGLQLQFDAGGPNATGLYIGSRAA